jgi:hypothetical protein
MMVHNSLMSRWLEQRSVWQYFIVMWAVTVSAALVGALSFAVVFGHGHIRTGAFEFIPLGSLIAAAGGTLGRQIWKRTTASRLRD